MGDLHSIAYSSSSSSLLHNSSSLGYGLHNNNNNHLGVFNADLSQYFFELESSISSSTPPFLAHFESPDFSTGYLQDALFEFSSKRRRLEFCSSSSDDDDHQLDSCTKRICQRSMNYLDDYDQYMSTIMANSDSISVEPASEEEGSLFSEMTKTKEEAISSADTFDISSSMKQFSSVNSNTTTTTTTTTQSSDSDKENLRSIDPRFPSAGTGFVFLFGVFFFFFFFSFLPHKYHYLVLHYLLSVFPFCFTQLVKRENQMSHN
ncbi:OLC1v1033101C1 [Oldenlandia corymbosa var. corymbosa]|uniref:OLC1v1033101C1 n=1 Tax=Oldenlandia corymbosa var. corymbosa TaxID=529605 RepID=A0AAV1CN55_OLDCO|nr:OLC1v1033101C1 [Oldenlandia corymbosa var. corymbosa]